MRRWKRIKDGWLVPFNEGDILESVDRLDSSTPTMKRISDGTSSPSDTEKMVEIDEYGNTIRTYKEGDKLNEGTLVGGNMDKKKAMERLDAIENEAKELRKILERPDRIEYDETKIYVMKLNGSSAVYTHILVGKKGNFMWFTLCSTRQTFNDVYYLTEQDALDCVLGREDCTIHAFSNRNDALKFMMENS